MSQTPKSTFEAVPLSDLWWTGKKGAAPRTIYVRSGLDPSRILEYRDGASVLGAHAADHVLMGEYTRQSRVLGAAPALEAKRPSFWRQAAIKAATHVLVHLVNPRPRPSELNQHLDHDGRGIARGLQTGKHRHLIDDGRLEVLDDGHVITLRISRPS